MPPDSLGTSRIGIRCDTTDADVVERLERLGRQLGAPVQTGSGTDGDLWVVGDARGIGLRPPGAQRARVLRVDLVTGPIGHLRRTGRLQADRPLFRAVGARGDAANIVDATAGLGRDAFLLAARGFHVTAVERSPVLATLLEDGLARAARHPSTARQIGGRLRVVHADARDWLRALPEANTPDVVYLDPMYPLRKSSALTGIEMRILRELVGDDEDATDLYEVARQVSRGRIVVKRMSDAPPLAGAPARSYKGRTTRYDVYEVDR